MATKTSDLTTSYQRYFSKELLKHAIQMLVLSQFAQQGQLPRNRGVKSVRYFRKVEAATDKVVELTEGTTPSERRKVTFNEVDIDLRQFGEVATITDIVGMTALFNMLKEHISTMGEDAALFADTHIRDEVLPAITATSQNRFSQGIADFATLDAATAANGKFVRTDILKACTQLKINRAPKFGGYYICALPPQVGQDLQQDDDWLEASRYGKPEQLFAGELGRLDGARFVEHTNPFLESDTANTFDAAGDIYSTLFIGKGAYGCPKLAGTGTPWKPQVMITPDQASDSDPLNQRRSVGWKLFWNAAVLNQQYIVRMRSKSTFA